MKIVSLKNIIILLIGILIIGALSFIGMRYLHPQALAASDISIMRIEGSIQYKAADSDEFIDMNEVHKIIEPNSIIKTLNDGIGYLLFDEFSFHELQPNSEIEVLDTIKGISLFQKAGSIIHSFNPDNDTLNNNYNIKTPNVTASVRGTSFEIQVDDTEDQDTIIWVIEGEVEAEMQKSQEKFNLQSARQLEILSKKPEASDYDLQKRYPEGYIDSINSIHTQGHKFDQSGREKLEKLPRPDRKPKPEAQENDSQLPPKTDNPLSPMSTGTKPPKPPLNR